MMTKNWLIWWRWWWINEYGGGGKAWQSWSAPLTADWSHILFDNHHDEDDDHVDGDDDEDADHDDDEDGDDSEDDDNRHAFRNDDNEEDENDEGGVAVLQICIVHCASCRCAMADRLSKSAVQQVEMMQILC